MSPGCARRNSNSVRDTSWIYSFDSETGNGRHRPMKCYLLDVSAGWLLGTSQMAACTTRSLWWPVYRSLLSRKYWKFQSNLLWGLNREKYCSTMTMCQTRIPWYPTFFLLTGHVEETIYSLYRLELISCDPYAPKQLCILVSWILGRWIINSSSVEDSLEYRKWWIVSCSRFRRLFTSFDLSPTRQVRDIH